MRALTLEGEQIWLQINVRVLQLQAELAVLSTDADHRVVEDAAHYIQFDNPSAVITAVGDVVNAVRQGKPVGKVRGLETAVPKR